MNFKKCMIDIIGRGSICILAAIGINKSEWYQATSGSIPLNDPFGWMVALAFIGCFVWISYPVYEVWTQTSSKEN